LEIAKNVNNRKSKIVDINFFFLLLIKICIGNKL
jgi:hypothetical protein